MFEELKTAKKIVGLKQLRRAMRDGAAKIVFLAEDADPWIREEIEALCQRACIVPIRVPTMKALGAACRISVGTATAAVLTDPSE